MASSSSTQFSNDLPAIQRVVTSHTPSGDARIWIDEEVERKIVGGPKTTDGVSFGLAWVTDQSPAEMQVEEDGINLKIGELASEDGSVVRYVDMPPHHVSPMHRTTSLDYGFVLFGDIELELPDGTFTKMKVGDVCVQRGTSHAWHNKTDKWARMVYVLLPGKPIEIDGKVLKDQSIH